MQCTTGSLAAVCEHERGTKKRNETALHDARFCPPDEPNAASAIVRCAAWLLFHLNTGAYTACPAIKSQSVLESDTDALQMRHRLPILAKRRTCTRCTGTVPILHQLLTCHVPRSATCQLTNPSFRAFTLLAKLRTNYRPVDFDLQTLLVL